jgi:hypothetical protein
MGKLIVLTMVTVGAAGDRRSRCSRTRASRTPTIPGSAGNGRRIVDRPAVGSVPGVNPEEGA